MKRAAIWTICLLLGISLAASRLPETPQNPAHFHIDFKLFIKGKQIDLAQAKYQADEHEAQKLDIHLHDGNGDVVHFHKSGLTLQHLMQSLDGSLTPNCLYFEGQKFCTGFTNSLKVYVNGKRLLLPHRYLPEDEDKILITYGPHYDKDLETQLSSVSNTACIYSLKCPERGDAPTENCIGSGNTPCVVPGTQ